ncbi:endonuclease III [Candidatus Dojkabacteria bacterium]|uniref:Endonuclease III n=1 Tax=Candidatus Dojkabacteria bacterium TaxID=2099670 RepID=A0A955L6V3_9BACT|nr:endonuclease III [Candidatus Dojkabacteria bacterium]
MNKSKRKKRASDIIVQLRKRYPSVSPPLNHSSAFELLIAVILSAQCTDARVNLVTPELFNYYNTPEKLAYADLNHVKELIRSTGFYNNKSKNIVGAARKIVEEFDGKVPDTMGDLLTLPGVARKTANVVLGQWFGTQEGIAVDTHIIRLSQLLGLTNHSDPKKIEQDLIELVPQEDWTYFSLALIMYGREFCPSKKHDYTQCFLGGHE